jgi:hypothetical protein
MQRIAGKEHPSSKTQHFVKLEAYTDGVCEMIRISAFVTWLFVITVVAA